MNLKGFALVDFLTSQGYYWAVRLALEKGLHNASLECTTYVSTLMEDLEGVCPISAPIELHAWLTASMKRKEALKGDDRLDDDMAARAYVENFAFKVFDNGSRAVEMGRATE